MRQDVGVLWENFIISERIKYLQNNRIFANIYFWRTKQGQEIDFVEERDGKIFATEIKYSSKKSSKIPNYFKETYSPEFQIVNKDNFFKFLT